MAIDKADGEPYIFAMSKFRHLLLIAILVTYAAGLGVSAAGAAAMTGYMAMGGTGETGDCQGCDPVGGGDSASACDTPCLPSLLATLTSDAALWIPDTGQATDALGSSFAGLTGSPDPSPPRSILLS